MDNEVLSVGIDIGTTTTSMIVSRLGMANTAASFQVPDVNITKKEILYRSELYMTPLKDRDTLDGDRIREIIEFEYNRAGIRPSQVDTGAVIITGESSLKKNASIVIQSLSSFAGEFVVATAGPDLESVIAGRGAGAEAFSKKYGCTVANLDIGGGTTNVAVFNCGELVDKTCIDVGGRLIKYDDQRRVTYVSERLNDLASELRGFRVAEGEVMDDDKLDRIGDLMAEAVYDSIHLTPRTAARTATTKSSQLMRLPYPIDFISFSGGVADCYYKNMTENDKFGDLGVALAKALRRRGQNESFQVITPSETIRATVVGAGTYTTEVSGSTISYTEDVFPIKNLPVYVFERGEEDALYRKDVDTAIKGLVWYMDQSQEDRLAISVKGKEMVTYKELCNLADSLIEVNRRLCKPESPYVIICENDMAKALGQVMLRNMVQSRTTICLDRIRIHSGDYIDIGRPVMGGIAVPIVVKTLIFD